MFTENQVRQFYVIPTGNADTTNVQQPTKIVSGTSGTYPADLKALAAGACQFVVAPAGDEAYLMYKGPLDGPQRSDLIKKCNVMDVRLTDATDLVHKNKKCVVTLEDALVSSSNLVLTGDYVLNVSIHNYVSMDYNTTKIKFGAAHGVAGTSASDLYKKLALNLAKNFKREPASLVNVYITKTNATGNTSNNVLVTGSEANISAISGTAVGIVIEEAEQPWRLGAAPQEFVEFSVEPSTVYNATTNSDVVWGKVQFYGSSTYTNGTSSNVTIAAGGTQVNSKKVADMEWFFYKERGDRYGEMCWPWNIDTKLLVNPDLAAGYSFVDIHYYFEGNSHNVGKSEKTLTIVGSKANLNRLIGVPYTPASGNDPAVDATGLYAFLEDTGVEIKKSANWG